MSRHLFSSDKFLLLQKKIVPCTFIESKNWSWQPFNLFKQIFLLATNTMLRNILNKKKYSLNLTFEVKYVIPSLLTNSVKSFINAKIN